MSNTEWMVRAGRNAQFLGEFLEQGVVGIGWRDIGDLSGFRTQKAVLQAVQTTWRDWKPGKQAVSTNQMYRRASEMSIVDKILTYEPHPRKVIGDVPTAVPFKNEKWPGFVSLFGTIRSPQPIEPKSETGPWRIIILHLPSSSNLCRDLNSRNSP